MGFDVVIVGGGTAGCVLAARLSENPARSVCLVEAGPDYGPLSDGRWPAEILDAREMPFTHDWGSGSDGRSLGARIIGGSSSHNACVVVAGSPSDYDEWGLDWDFAHIAPFLDRARSTLRTARRNTDRPAPFLTAFMDAAQAVGFPPLADPDDPSTPVGVASCPSNVDSGRRWNAAFAYLDDARGRPNLVVEAETLVDRVVLDSSTAQGVVCADGRRFDAQTVILTAGAYLSPTILMRSGIGPASQLQAHGIDVVEDLPVGDRLLDHCGTHVDLGLATDARAAMAALAAEEALYEHHAVLKAASSRCTPGSWDLHLLPWCADRDGEYGGAVIVFHMKPLSVGRLELRSPSPGDLPLVERGFLTREDDLATLVEGFELARTICATEPLRDLVDGELAPGERDTAAYVRETIRNYFHPAGTCPLGTVVDTHARVFGIDGLYVADASFMPTIPRANTNLTTAAIAERIAADFA